jgi:glycosyltransferase involved in cell wall biosynthesis
MNIVIVGPAYPYRGGIADTNESFARSLMKVGHKVDIVTFKLQYPSFLFPGKTQYSEDKPPKDLKIHRWINTVLPTNWYLAASKINKLKPDLVIFRYWLPFLAPCLGTIARNLKKDICKIAMCDNIVPHEKRIGDRGLTKYFVHSFDGFITLSRTVKNELEDFTSRPIRFFPHPINDNLGDKIEREKALTHLGLAPEYRYLLFFGMVRKYKGLDLMIKAIADPRLADKKIRLIVAGEFYDDPVIYQDMMNKYDVTDKVIIRNEFIPTDDIRYYFSCSDLLTQTYHTASQSGVTQIAYHFDLPVLVTDVGALSEFIPHQKVGYVTKKDPDNIAEYIIDFVDNDRKQYFSEQVKIEKQKYSWEAFSDELISLAGKLKKEK